MPKWLGGLLLAVLAALFLIANRGAYGGYFQDDDLDNISWTSRADGQEFLFGLLTPRLATNNFRPTGHFVYKVLASTAALRFPPYIAVLHVAHLLTVWLLWLVARKLNIRVAGATAAALFFAFHMAAFDAYWRPMYIFDVLCGFFCLLSLLAYLNDRLVLSLLTFWLAYKSKELAVMLPLVLGFYELSLGNRRWKRLLPFLAISAVFGLQALVVNRGRSDDYSLHFTPAALWTCLRYYASQVLLAPWLGFALVPLPFLVKDRRIAFGLVSAILLMAPLLVLPGRLHSVYLYLPLIAVSLALAALADRLKPAYLAAFFLFWLPLNYTVLIGKRKDALTTAHENRRYVTQAAAFFAHSPDIETVIFDGAPPGLHRWGAEAALRLTTGKPGLEILDISHQSYATVRDREGLAVATWSQPLQTLFMAAKLPDAPARSYITMGRENPIWQLTDGWYPLESDFRWIRPAASAYLYKPDNARRFELTINVSPGQLSQTGPPEVTVLLGDKTLGTIRLPNPGWTTAHWDLPSGLPVAPNVRFRVSPEYHPGNDPRTLGAAIVAFGFIP